jgi:hypothetical protein
VPAARGARLLKRAHPALELLNRAVDLVDLGARRQARGLDQRLDHLALGQQEIHAMAQELALCFQERLRPMRLEQGPVGDIQPQLERCFRLGGCLASTVALLELGRKAPVGLGPSTGDNSLVATCRLLHRQPELHDLGHAPLDGPQIGQARPLGHAPDRLADLAAADQGQR